MKLFSQTSHIDWLFALPVLVIPVFGLTLLLSSSESLFFKQLLNFGIGIVVFYFLSKIDLGIFQTLAPYLYIFAIVLLLSVFAITDPTRGSYRWLYLWGAQIQVSEIAKLVLVIFFAYFLSSRSIKSVKNVISGLVLAAAPCLLIFREPDLGTSVVVGVSFFVMLFLSGIKYRYVVILLSLVVLSLPMAWKFTHQYQRDRFLAFLEPQKDPLGVTYNINQSIIAVGSGQLFGRGLGQGPQTQLQFLPEHNTDFIFASLGEELGLVGTVLLVFAYTWLFWRLIVLGQRQNDRFRALLLFGCATIIITQAFIHIGGNIGILPVTGITLPLISYGGSSVIVICALLGIAVNATSQSDTRLTAT